MSRFKKHLGEGKTIVIDGEDFLIKPLTTEEAPLFFRIMSLFEEGKFDMSKMNKESEGAFTQLLNMTLQKSFPKEWEKDQEELKCFGLKYMMDLLPAILDVNMPSSDEKLSRVEELKKRIGPK